MLKCYFLKYYKLTYLIIFIKSIIFTSDIRYYEANQNLICFHQGGLGGRGERGGMGGVGGDGGDGGFAGVLVYQGRVITDGSQQVKIKYFK